MTSTTVEKELLELERRYWRAIQDKDAVAAARLTDFPCIITGAQGLGKIDEQTFAQVMKNPPYTILRVELSDDAQVRLVQDDVAVVAYKVHEELTVDGKPVSLDAADASTWVRRNGQWRCALHTESIAGDPYGRDRSASR